MVASYITMDVLEQPWVMVRIMRHVNVKGREQVGNEKLMKT